MTKYKRVYEMLKSYGFEPVKALEIIIDARRGSAHALTWIRMIRMAGR